MILVVLTLSGCAYNGDSLFDVTSVGGPDEPRLAPSFPLDVPPEERARTSAEREALEQELAAAAAAHQSEVVVPPPTLSQAALLRRQQNHFEEALAEIQQEAASGQTQ